FGSSVLWEPVTTYPPRVLFINSERDEAFGFLHGVRAAPAWPENEAVHERKSTMVPWLRTVAREAWAEDAQRYPWGGRQLGLWVASFTAVGILAFPLLGYLRLSWLLPTVASWFVVTGLIATLTVPGLVFFAVAAPWRVAEAGSFFLRSFFRRLVGPYA